MSELTEEEKSLKIKAMTLNGKIIGSLNEKAMKSYVAELEELADELDVGETE